MTTRQWKLYLYLKANYCEGYYISKKQICEDLKDYYKYDENTNRHNTDIEYDIRAINDDEDMQKAIVSNRVGYKIGNEQECNEYLQRRFNSIGKSLKTLWGMKKRLEQNGQMRLTFGKERDTIIAFMQDSDNE